MTKKREENIKELENKFKKSIQDYLDNKQFIIDEYKKINITLETFQLKQDTNLDDNRKRYRSTLKDFKEGIN